MKAGDRACAFGNDCVFSSVGYVYKYPMDEQGMLQFCHDFGVSVSKDDCYNDGSRVTVWMMWMIVIYCLY